MARRRDRKRRSARSVPHRAARRRLLVVCEGERTEPDYIRGLERHVRNATVKVEIPKERGDPKRLVEIAKRLSREAKAEAKRRGDPFLAFDEVWCVFDRDEHERFDDACVMARDNGLLLAVSNPCVELWLLLHLRESPGARHRNDVQQMLRQFLPSYRKRLNFDSVRHGVTAATERAHRLDTRAKEDGEAGRNPTTGFYGLVQSILRPSGSQST